jgi:hypothetical protein
MRTAASILPATCLALAVAGGCQNPSHTLVHAGPDPIPDIEPATAEPLPREGGAVTLDGTPVAKGAKTAPSTTSLDRSAWATTTVVQPRGQVEVQPTYYQLFEGFSGDPRAVGAYPTTATALHTNNESPMAVEDGFAAPVIGMLWLASVPGQLIVMPPWTVRRQPNGIEWLPASTPELRAAAPAQAQEPAKE